MLALEGLALLAGDEGRRRVAVEGRSGDLRDDGAPAGDVREDEVELVRVRVLEEGEPLRGSDGLPVVRRRPLGLFLRRLLLLLLLLLPPAAAAAAAAAPVSLSPSWT